MYFLRSEPFKNKKIQFEVYKMKILDFADFLKIPLWDFFMTHNFGGVTQSPRAHFPREHSPRAHSLRAHFPRPRNILASNRFSAQDFQFVVILVSAQVVSA